MNWNEPFFVTVTKIETSWSKVEFPVYASRVTVRRAHSVMQKAAGRQTVIPDPETCALCLWFVSTALVVLFAVPLVLCCLSNIVSVSLTEVSVFKPCCRELCSKWHHNVHVTVSKWAGSYTDLTSLSDSQVQLCGLAKSLSRHCHLDGRPTDYEINQLLGTLSDQEPNCYWYSLWPVFFCHPKVKTLGRHLFSGWYRWW